MCNIFEYSKSMCVRWLSLSVFQLFFFFSVFCFTLCCIANICFYLFVLVLAAIHIQIIHNSQLKFSLTLFFVSVFNTQTLKRARVRSIFMRSLAIIYTNRWKLLGAFYENRVISFVFIGFVIIFSLNRRKWNWPTIFSVVLSCCCAKLPNDTVCMRFKDDLCSSFFTV